MVLANLKDAINNHKIVVIILCNNSNTKIHDLSKIIYQIYLIHINKQKRLKTYTN